MSTDAFVSRMIVLYGQPDSADDGAFLDEIKEMLAGASPAVLKAAGDIIRSTHTRRGWPSPGEIQAAIRQAAAKCERAQAQPVAAVEYEFVGPEDERFVKALTEARVDAPAYARLIEARGFIKVEKLAAGPAKARVGAVITDLSKRMTGERDENAPASRAEKKSTIAIEIKIDESCFDSWIEHLRATGNEALAASALAAGSMTVASRWPKEGSAIPKVASAATLTTRSRAMTGE